MSSFGLASCLRSTSAGAIATAGSSPSLLSLRVSASGVAVGKARASSGASCAVSAFPNEGVSSAFAGVRAGGRAGGHWGLQARDEKPTPPPNKNYVTCAAAWLHHLGTVRGQSEDVERERAHAEEGGPQIRPRRPGLVERLGAVRAVRTDAARFLRHEVRPCASVSMSRKRPG